MTQPQPPGHIPGYHIPGTTAPMMTALFPAHVAAAAQAQAATCPGGPMRPVQVAPGTVSARWSLICGILGILFTPLWVGLIPAQPIAAVLALVLGIRTIKRTSAAAGRSMAIAGIVLGAGDLLLSGFALIFMVALVTSAGGVG